MHKVAIFLLRIYQYGISPMLPPHCRFYPTCSQYAIVALQRHGFFLGTLLALRRILCCHPFHPGGVDFVPERESGSNSDLKGEISVNNRSERGK